MPPRTLPADPSPTEHVARMIRVDQAGEYGAMRIYAGQLAVLKNSAASETIRHMAEQEERHLATFNRLLAKRRVRPTALQPLWHLGGWLMGAGTALLGEKAAMACTVAVESVIDEHYAKQLEMLPSEEADLKKTIADFRADEIAHHDTGIAHGAEDAPLYSMLTAVVRAQTKFAIWLSTRF